MTSPDRVVERVRDAMVSSPPVLDREASVRDAGETLARPEVRAVFVCAEGRLLGVITRKTLVREVVARGLDPVRTTVGEIAEEPYYTLDADAPLDEAFRFMEEHDAERVPIVEQGRLVGVLSRAVIQRRLAENEPVADDAA